MHGAYSVKMVVIFLISYEFIPNAHADNFRILDTNMYSSSLENTGFPPRSYPNYTQNIFESKNGALHADSQHVVKYLLF